MDFIVCLLFYLVKYYDLVIYELFFDLVLVEYYFYWYVSVDYDYVYMWMWE